MQFIPNIKEISKLYDYFIFDVWGVVHDGSEAYPGAIEAISFLRQEGKKICFLSNAPRRAFKVEKMLQNFGVTPDLYDFVMSSGEATFLDLQKNQNDGFDNYGKKYFYIGPEKDIDLLDGLDYQKTTSASEADFAIVTGFDGAESTLAEKLPQALEAKKYNLPMICVNPDMIVVKQDGSKMICAGALAAEYKRIGGKVIFYGKPFSSVYKMVHEIFDKPDISKVLMVGDGIETDIKGAKDFSIDSLLVTGGIISNLLKIDHQESVNAPDLEKICNQYKLFPKFVISNLKI